MALIRLFLVVSVCIFISDCSPGRKKGQGGRKSKKVSDGGSPVTCPGFPGYCSESYPGGTCLVVCAFGRNNVPVCQDDGTWTAEPRCIEHEPGKQEQVPGTCPGVPGYCSLDLPGGLCTFECISGPHVRSSCKPDGTWDPYPTCDGDVRETKDGCDPCPGPFGGPRNRTAEAGGGRGGGSVTKSNNVSTTSGRKQGGGPNKRGGSAKRKSGGSRNGGQKRNGGSQKRNGGSQKKNGRNQNANSGGKRKSGSGQSRANGSSKSKKGGCPDAVLQACIDVCPGSNTKVFGACVAGCSKRC